MPVMHQLSAHPIHRILSNERFLEIASIPRIGAQASNWCPPFNLLTLPFDGISSHKCNSTDIKHVNIRNGQLSSYIIVIFLAQTAFKQ